MTGRAPRGRLAAGAETSRLVELAERARVHVSPWARYLAESPGRHLNHVASAWEETARLNCSYQQFIVPGLAQTERYTRALAPHLPVDLDVDAHVGALMRRQDILHDPGHEFRFVLTRRAWTWTPDPDSPIMAAQHDRLRRLDELPTVGVRVLEDDAVPMGGYGSYTIYDRREDAPDLVVIEVERGHMQLNDGGDLAHYRRRFDELWDAATPL